MADIKSLLKEARKHIDDKNFKEAQECCKNILRKDKQNYFGLVLLGKSLQDSDQAPLAYWKAIESKPEQPLAWQGLANYYEAKDDDDDAKAKLFSIYRELIKLQIEEEKTLEILSRLCYLGCTMKNSQSINILTEYLMRNDLPPNISKVAVEQFIKVLKADVPCEEKDINNILKILDGLNNDDQNEQLQLIYCKILIQKSDFYSAVEEIINLPFFSQNVIVREWLCKQLCIKYTENMSFEGFNIETYINSITEGVVNSKYPNLLKSMIAYENRQYLDAYKQCVPLINYQHPDAVEAIFIIRCTMMLKKWPITQKLVMNFLSKVKDNNLACELNKHLFYALAKQQKWKEAVTVSKNIPLDMLSLSEQALLAGCYIELDSISDNIFDNLKSTEYHTHLQAQLLIKQQRYADVINILQNCADDALSAFYLGKAFWELQQYDKCLINLLKSAKLNPEHPDTFLYLGHIYYYLKEDLDKAKKCYEKAYNLNNLDYDIAKSLSEIYIKLKRNNENFELLQNLAKDMSKNETWVYFRLGLHYLNQREWENAIINFRNVIKTNSNETTAFECLADAYYGRGSYTSALRAYNRVMSIDPKKTAHCLTRIGYIYSLLTQYEESVETFEKVLELEPHSILALKGIAETWMRIAKKKLASKIYGNARDCAQNAINYIIRALTRQTQFSCFWKLLGDLLIFITQLPNKYAFVYMPQLKRGANSEVVKMEKFDIFPEAIVCYSYITKQKQQVASYDLALTYLAYYNETQKEVNCHIAFNITMTCIKEKPLLWHNWNLLGKTCLVIKKYELAQHCFIKALLTTRKWSVAKIWCNLGTLYLKLKLYKLANYCFSRGQSTMPSYPQSWIGQGLIAEAIREEEAMDLFRHASRLGYHPESALGYGDWVCRTLKNNKYSEDTELKYVIEGLHAIPYATDLLEWFCNFDSENACAYTILGILQERGGLINAALKSYGKALQYADESKKNIALLNVGRILNRTGHYDSAIKVYKSITEASLNSTTGLALALLKKGLYEEAYSAYDTALHWLSDDDDEKSDLLVAMAGTVYKFKGVNEAKTLLFHSIQISQKKPTATSLFAICCLGLLHADKSLSKLALSELRKYDKEINYAFDIGFLKSFLLVSEGNVEHAYKVLSDSLHDYPHTPLLWFCMAQYCLMDNNLRANVASRCAQKALCAAQMTKKSDNCNFAKIMATASIAEHIAGDSVKSLLLAKDGLHMYPSQVEIWAALLRSLLSHKMCLERKPWILHMIEHIRKHLNASRRLVKWITIIEKKLSR